MAEWICVIGRYKKIASTFYEPAKVQIDNPLLVELFDGDMAPEPPRVQQGIPKKLAKKTP